MKQGDFTTLAENYIHRTGYSHAVLGEIVRHAGCNPGDTPIADVGAGTGKLTENLAEFGFTGWAVEPNDAMRGEGIRLLEKAPFVWRDGTAEETGLPDACVNLVFMGSSFHWTDPEKALPEFRRILKPGGFFIALWNPRNIECDPFHQEIEEWIHEKIPHLQRRSSGSSRYTQAIEKTLVKDGHFKNVVFMEDAYTVEMSKERYLGAWRSVNDIRSQAGEEKFQKILGYIAEKVGAKPSVIVPYRTRAWMVQATQKT